MLYNLSERKDGLPTGNLYLPIFTKLMDNEYGRWLEKKYLERKNEWINNIREGSGDVLESLKKRIAVNFVHDSKYLQLKTKKERNNYITLKLGSSWTTAEKEIVEGYTKLLRDGMIDEDELKEEKE